MSIPPDTAPMKGVKRSRREFESEHLPEDDDLTPFNLLQPQHKKRKLNNQQTYARHCNTHTQSRVRSHRYPSQLANRVPTHRNHQQNTHHNHRGSNSTQPMPKQNKPPKQKETDLNRVAQRLKQIELVKQRDEYKFYVNALPKSKRKRTDPQTPNCEEKLSTRRFKGKMRAWKISLHQFRDNRVKTQNIGGTEATGIGDKKSMEKENVGLTSKKDKFHCPKCQHEFRTYDELKGHSNECKPKKKKKKQECEVGVEDELSWNIAFKLEDKENMERGGDAVHRTDKSEEKEERELSLEEILEKEIEEDLENINDSDLADFDDSEFLKEIGLEI